MASTTETVRIHYRRPPDRDDIYTQILLERTAECVVTFMPATPLRAPVMVGETVALEPDASAIWFTFPGAWHDIGRFHLRDGTFTGTYANAITPVQFVDTLEWQTTDLFLDFWFGADGRTLVLDGDEFDDAMRRGWLDTETAARARLEMDGIARAAALGEWPPAIVEKWDLERARRVSERDGTLPVPPV